MAPPTSIAAYRLAPPLESTVSSGSVMNSTQDLFCALEGLKILVLDGGDARCFSQLEIIGEFMRRVNEDRVQNPLEPLRPCQYFDLILGTGFGGIVAVLLGALGLDYHTAQCSFAKICASLDEQPGATPQQHSSRLEDITSVILQEAGVNPGTKLLNHESSIPHCNTALCVIPAANTGSWRLLRNYETSQFSYDPTLLEAIKATSAMPILFESVHLGPEGQQETFISGAVRFNNPIWIAIEEAQNIFGKLRPVSCLLSVGSGILPPVSLGKQSVDIEKLIQQVATDGQMVAEQVSKRIGDLGVYFRFSVDRGFEDEVISLGEITSHTLAYLHTKEVSDKLDRCVTTANRQGCVTIGRLYGSQSTKPSPTNGLPRRSAFFLRRENPWRRLKEIMLPEGPRSQRLAIVSGMAGAGKTQAVVDFTTSHQDRYQRIFFVDASTAKSLESGLLLCLRSLGAAYDFLTIQEALEFLAQPDKYVTRDYLIIFDNADDRNLNLIDYIPSCEHGSFIITTRDPSKGTISPRHHLTIDVMTPEEASQAFLSVVFRHRDEKPSDQDREEAMLIVEELGCLPLAVVQAGCYIHQQKCLHDYRNRLKRNRKAVMQKPATHQLNKLNYEHSAYAAFETSFKALSPASQQLLGILSFCEPSSFRRSIIEAGATSGFAYEYEPIADTPDSFESAVTLLTGVFGKDEAAAQSACDEILEELQAYSLVSLSTDTALRMHHLTHAWARDRLNEQDHNRLRMAAIRLMASAFSLERERHTEHLAPHINALFQDGSHIPLNDRASFLYSLFYDGSWTSERYVEEAEKLVDDVTTMYGENNVRTASARILLADAYFKDEQTDLCITMERKLLQLQRTVLGDNTRETLRTMQHLACSLRLTDKFEEAEKLGEEVLRRCTESYGSRHKKTAEAQEELARTYQKRSKHSEAISLLLSALETHKLSFPSHHPMITWTVALLGFSYDAQGQACLAERVREESLRPGIMPQGSDAELGQLDALKWLAREYYEQKQYSRCEALRRQELEGRRRLQGNTHLNTLDAVHMLAHICFEQANYVEAQALWIEGVEGLRQFYGSIHPDTLHAMNELARTYFLQANYAEAQTILKEELEGRRQLHGLHPITLDVMRQLANVYHRQTHFADEETILKEELEGRRQLHGPVHSYTLNTMHQLADAYNKQAKYIEAQTLWQEEVEGRRQVHGAMHTETLHAMHELGHTYFAQDNCADAQIVWKEELEGRRQLDKPLDLHTLHVVNQLAHTYFLQTNYPEAQKLWKEELEGRRQLQDPSDTFEVIFWLGRTCLAENDYSQAKELFQEALDGYESLCCPHYEPILQTKDYLAQIHMHDGDYAETIRLWEQVLERRDPEHPDNVTAKDGLKEARLRLKSSPPSLPPNRHTKVSIPARLWNKVSRLRITM